MIAPPLLLPPVPVETTAVPPGPSPPAPALPVCCPPGWLLEHAAAAAIARTAAANSRPLRVRPRRDCRRRESLGAVVRIVTSAIADGDS
jgi:hypothetical protein